MSSFQVPENKVGLIVGQKGATVKRLQSNYNVKIHTPRKDQRSTNGMHTISIEGPMQNAQACQQEILGLISGNGGGGAGNVQFGAVTGQFGSSGGFGGAQSPPMGGGTTKGLAFIFKVNPSTMQVEVLLQQRANTRGVTWGVPSGPMDQPSDAEGQYASGVVRVLTQTTSGGHPIPFMEMEPLQPVSITGKIIQHLVVPQWGDKADAWNGWVPAPTPGTESNHGSPQPLLINNMQQQVTSYHSWVPLSLLQQCQNQCPQEIKMWLQKNSTSVVQQLQAVYAKFQMGGVQVGGASSNASTPVDPNWGTTPEGQAKMAKFHHVVKTLSTMDPNTFVQAVQYCFDPSGLDNAFQKWTQAGQSLPN